MSGELFWFECCSKFASGGYCPFCHTRRSLVIDDSQFLQLMKLDESMESLCGEFGSLGLMIFRYALRILPCHIDAYLDYLLSVIPLQIMPKILETKKRLIVIEERAGRGGVPSASLTPGELDQLRDILTDLECRAADSEINRVFCGIVKIAILNLLNSAILKQPPK